MEKYLVIASGGIDSGITANVLKEAGANVEIVHFVYGQRSWLAELYAVYKIASYLQLPLKVFDVSDLYKLMHTESSFLMNPNAKVYSGLKQFKKSVAAWVPGRNMLFATITATYAESLMLDNPNIEKTYLASGWAQLSESGSYPDNSERFNSALEHLFKFGLLKGHRIHMLNVLSDIMKYEEWILGKALGFPFQYTCSCDNPKVVFKRNIDQQSLSSYKSLMQYLDNDLNNLDDIIDHIELCIECGSTKNSRWAAMYANVEDPRRFYVSKQHPKGFDPYEIDVKPKHYDYHTALNNIINRLNIDKTMKNKLREKLLTGR